MDAVMEPESTSSRLTTHMFWVALVYQLCAIGGLAITSYLVWNKAEIRIMFVPLAVWQWSFLGAVSGVLYRISVHPGSEPQEKRDLYMWAIARPFIGTALGGVIYFLAASGMLALSGKADIQNIQLLCGISFLTAFSDGFSQRLLDKVMGSIAGPQRQRRFIRS